MPKNYNWRIKRDFYNLIIKGIKTLEVRVGYRDVRSVRVGDTITFKDYSNIKFEVVRVARYKDFPEMLDIEDISKVLPNVNKYEALSMYQDIYPEDKEALGVYVFELCKQPNDMKIYKLSSLIENHNLFIKFAYLAYSITDDRCKYYPNYFEWFWGKEIPRILNGTGEIIICTINKNVSGVVCLKKDNVECKICTFLVVEDYRNKHISSILLEQSFKYLGTTTPLITIPSEKVPMFEHIIEKYRWELTQIMDEGYYTDTSREYVYNGKLSE